MAIRFILVICAAVAGLFATSSSHTAAYTAAAESRDPVALATSTDASYNWAGYVADSGAYTAVSATWTVPAVSTQAPLAADATWVGIGGVDSNDLIQAGTQALVQSDGTTQYEAWYETLPHVSQAVPLEVSAGDVVSVALTYLGSDKWHVSFVDNTTGKNYSLDTTYSSNFSSAEWIQEMPMGEGGGRHANLIPLDDFGSLDFSAASTVVDGNAQSPLAAGATPLRMVSAVGETLAAPSTLTQNGGFTVMRTDASAQVAERPQRERIIYIQF